MLTQKDVSEYLINRYLSDNDKQRIPLELKEYIDSISKEYLVFKEPLLLLLKEELKINLPIENDCVFINNKIKLYLSQFVSCLCDLSNTSNDNYDFINNAPQFIIKVVFSEGYKKIKFKFKASFLDDNSTHYYSATGETPYNQINIESLDYNYKHELIDDKKYILTCLENYFTNFIEKNSLKIEHSINKLFQLGNVFDRIIASNIKIEDYLKNDKWYSYDSLTKEIEHISDFLLLNDVDIRNDIEKLQSLKITKEASLKL